jgi:hypothetical protein
MHNASRTDASRLTDEEAAHLAEMLHELLVLDEHEYNRPEAYSLPPAIWPQFRAKARLYREAVLLLALSSKASSDLGYRPILNAYETLLFSEIGPEYRERIRALKKAADTLTHLIWPRSQGNEFAWSMAWFAGILHAETNPAKLGKFAFDWRAAYVSALEDLSALKQRIDE